VKRSLAGLFALLMPDLALAGAEREAGFLRRYAEIGPALLACWKPPVGSEGMELTMVFAFHRSGAIQGKPRITYARLSGDETLRRRFVASTIEALAACSPLHFSASLGGAMAGRPFAMTFRAVAARRAA
jgi:hypothetical protein